MRELLITACLFITAMALRSIRHAIARKAGALMFLVGSFWLFYFPAQSVLSGLCGVLLWFFLPWVELLTRIRKMRLPLDNSLSHRPLPNPEFFPNAEEAAAAMEDAGFEHVTNCGWDWSGMHQYFQLFWHPEERAVASVCLCEQHHVAFAFISVTSRDDKGRLWRTTNYPFSPTLKIPPGIHWNHVPCERGCFHHILQDHRDFLKKCGVQVKDLQMPDPEDMEATIEAEMRQQVQHNLNAGIIRLTDDGHFAYSKRGLIFLWGQFVKDMVRLS